MAPVHGDMVLRAVVLFLFISLIVIQTSATYVYDKDDLFRIRDACVDITYMSKQLNLMTKFITDYNQRRIHSGAHHQQRKRGRRGGVLARLRRRGFHPALPSMYLMNVRSLRNKMDELLCHMHKQQDFRNCCIYSISETWLDSTVPDQAITPPGFMLFRSDRMFEVVNKERGGGVCMFINEAWCTNSTVLSKTCNPVLETITVKCRPFYLPREISSLILTTVYIPPEVNAGSAIDQLSALVTRHENAHPGSISIITGDFNHTNLRKRLPNYYQHIKCHTRKDRILDHCYTPVKDAYQALQRAPLGDADHNMIHLIPKYKQQLKREKPVKKTVKLWSTEATERLQGCYDCTDWNIFINSSKSIDECTDTVIEYMKFCEEICIPTKTVVVYPNKNLWFNGFISSKIRARQMAYKSGDLERYKIAKYDLRKSIKAAKRDFKNKLEQDFLSNDSRELWQGLNKITNYKPKSRSISTDDPTLPDKLNAFYSRFDKETRPTLDYLKRPTCNNTPSLVIQENDVRRQFAKLKVKKSAGPDGVAPRHVRCCSDQLAFIFSYIYNWSLSICKFPKQFKKSIIIPVPKRNPVTTLNDYRPVALTSVLSKTLERLVLHFLKSVVSPFLDQFQFAYRTNRSTDDAVALVAHDVLTHLDKRNCYARILFVDFSSAFNTIQPLKLYLKMLELNIPDWLCSFILEFLTGRPQVVKITNGNSTLFSTPMVLNTGAPQGCVLSPMLYTLFTYDCEVSSPNTRMVKFADDTTLAGLICNNNESSYFSEVQSLVRWCNLNNLELNVSKTKEIIIDFRKQPDGKVPLLINNTAVEIVKDFKFLGIKISDDLKWEANVLCCVKKARQRLYFLRQLKSFSIAPVVMESFYRAVIESVLTTSLTVWYGATTQEDRYALDQVVKSASKIIGIEQRPMAHLYDTRVTKRAQCIFNDECHPGNKFFEMLPSGRRYRSISTKTTRTLNSFYPVAIRTINSKIL